MPGKSSQPCRATRRDGQPCRAPALADGLCFAHSPTTAGLRTAACQTGGHNRANANRLRGLMPPRLISVYDRLEATLDGVLDGSVEPKQASAAAAVARAMVAVLTSGELEQRMRELERRES